MRAAVVPFVATDDMDGDRCSDLSAHASGVRGKSVTGSDHKGERSKGGGGSCLAEPADDEGTENGVLTLTFVGEDGAISV